MLFRSKELTSKKEEIAQNELLKEVLNRELETLKNEKDKILVGFEAIDGDILETIKKLQSGILKQQQILKDLKKY